MREVLLLQNTESRGGGRLARLQSAGRAVGREGGSAGHVEETETTAVHGVAAACPGMARRGTGTYNGGSSAAGRGGQRGTREGARERQRGKRQKVMVAARPGAAGNGLATRIAAGGRRQRLHGGRGTASGSQLG
jgi:hypothetical protein